MESEVRKKGAFDWGIAGVDLGVDLDDIEIPLNDTNNTLPRFERDSQALAMPSASDFASIYRLVDSSNESTSMFDRFPEAFVCKELDNLEPHLARQASDRASVFCRLPGTPLVEQNRLPYSWMIQNPGQVAKNLCSISPRPGNIKPKHDKKSLSNVDGETRMEEELKRGNLNPSEYFFRATALTCIMDLNSQGLIQPTLLATIIGRLFNGEPRFLDVFNKFFMPPGLHIEPTTRRAVLHACLLQIDHHLDVHSTHARDHRFITLKKVVHHLASSSVLDRVYKDEIVGKLVYASNGRHFRPDFPGGQTVLRLPKLSPRFLNRLGEWWPFKNLPWKEADQLGLLSTRKENGKKPTDTLDPRLIASGANPELGRER